MQGGSITDDKKYQLCIITTEKESNGIANYIFFKRAATVTYLAVSNSANKKKLRLFVVSPKQLKSLYY